MHGKKAKAVETSLGVRDRFNWLNIARWASCFLQSASHYLRVCACDVDLSQCVSPCFLYPFLPPSFFFVFSISYSANCHILTRLLSSYLFFYSHLYYHLHFLTIHSSFNLSSLQITVKTHTHTHTLKQPSRKYTSATSIRTHSK